MKAKPVPATIDVWRSYHCDTDYSVSLCEADGSEIRCLGGDDDREQAWLDACEHADEHGVPARDLGADGQATRTYQPESADD